MKKTNNLFFILVGIMLSFIPLNYFPSLLIFFALFIAGALTKFFSDKKYKFLTLAFGFLVFVEARFLMIRMSLDEVGVFNHISQQGRQLISSSVTSQPVSIVFNIFFLLFMALLFVHFLHYEQVKKI